MRRSPLWPPTSSTNELGMLSHNNFTASEGSGALPGTSHQTNAVYTAHCEGFACERGQTFISIAEKELTGLQVSPWCFPSLGMVSAPAELVLLGRSAYPIWKIKPQCLCGCVALPADCAPPDTVNTLLDCRIHVGPCMGSLMPLVVELS